MLRLWPVHSNFPRGMKSRADLCSAQQAPLRDSASVPSFCLSLRSVFANFCRLTLDSFSSRATRAHYFMIYQHVFSTLKVRLQLIERSLQVGVIWSPGISRCFLFTGSSFGLNTMRQLCLHSRGFHLKCDVRTNFSESARTHWL